MLPLSRHGSQRAPPPVNARQWGAAVVHPVSVPVGELSVHAGAHTLIASMRQVIASFELLPQAIGMSGVAARTEPSTPTAKS